jgi:hypothetical protein
MPKILSVLAISIWMTATAGAQTTDAQKLLDTSISNFESPNQKAKIAPSLLVLQNLSEIFAPEKFLNPLTKQPFGDTLKLDDFVKKLDASALKKQASDKDTIQDLANFLPKFKKMADSLGISPGSRLYNELASSVAILAASMKVDGSPIRQKSLCENPYIRWICTIF